MWNRINLPSDKVCELFKNGSSVFWLANHFNVSRTVIDRILRENRISSRSMKDASRTRYAKTSINYRKKITAKAQNIRRGSKESMKVKKQKALATEARQILSVGEQALVAIFRRYGFKVEPLKAVSIFNIDVALPDARLAIEFQGGNWHMSKRKAMQDAKKLRSLSKHGWTVLYLFKWSDYGHVIEIARHLSKLHN